MNPVFALLIVRTAIQRIGCKDEHEVLGTLDTIAEIGVKFARFEALDVDEDRKTS